MKAEREQRAAAAMSHPTEVADADESRRQHVQQESAQELVDRQRHQALLILVSGIAPAEGDDAVGKRDEAMVGDRHTMGVLAEIAKRMLRAAKRTFRVNYPWGAEQRTKPDRERLRILKRGERSVETEFVLRMQFSQAIHELAPEHFTENIDRQEESLLRVDPPRVVRRQTAGGNNTVNMRMMLEFLVPGVKDAEESDFRTEALRIAGDFQQRLGARAEQQGINLAFVLQGQRRKLPGQGKDHVDVARGQQFFSPRFQPAVARVSLTLRTMPVAARVVRDGLMSAS